MRCAALGCAAVIEPDGVANQAVPSTVFRSAFGGRSRGPLVYETVTMNARWSSIGRLGVTTSSAPCTWKRAGRPSTLTLRTVSPEKSRLKRESDWVARAWIEATAGTLWTDAVVA